VWLLSLLYALAMVLPLYPGPFTLGPILNGIVAWQLYAFFVMFAVLLVEKHASAGGASVWRYGIAVTCGVGLGILFYWFASQRLIGISTIQPGPRGYEPLATFAFRHGPISLTVFGLGTAVYVCRSRANQRLESLRAMQTDRVQVERDIAEARLAALQGRIEPTDVLARLERIEQFYDHDPPEAERMLEQFVKTLRAAIQR
jgi:sensor histidine kinase YesM